MLKVKNWRKFQHFKDRKPPWIKLYRDILDDPDWHDLDGDTAKTLVGIWLIASENPDGMIPDAKRLAFRLRCKESLINQALSKLGHWLERDDTEMISTGYHVDTPETETETEKETEFICPPNGELAQCDHKAVIQLYHEVLPTLRKVEVWNDSRASHLRQRWREVAKDLSNGKAADNAAIMKWWREFFEYVGKSKFLTGRTNDKSGRSFTADLEWILRPGNFAKIVEGKYHGT